MKKRLKFKRRREGRTDYKARLALLKSGKPRLVIRRTSHNIIAQVVDYKPEGDRVLASADLAELRREFGWKAGANLPAAYLVGRLLGKKAKKKKAVVDMGLHPATKGNRLFAVIKGAVDSGIKVPVNPEMFPSEDRINGKHIAEYAKQAKKPAFKQYGVKPEKIAEHFKQVLKKVEGA